MKLASLSQQFPLIVQSLAIMEGHWLQNLIMKIWEKMNICSAIT